jgi:hypothetical protein
MDPEAPLRKQLVAVLSPSFPVWEEVSLIAGSGRAVRADILFIEKQFSFPFAVALEVKS